MNLRKLKIRLKRLEEKVKLLRIEEPDDDPDRARLREIARPSKESSERIRNILEWAYEQSVEEKKKSRISKVKKKI